MPIWHRGPLAPFDTETTGINLEEDRIVTATVARIEPGSQTTVSNHLIAVDIDIAPEAIAVHGITTEYARQNGKPAAEVLDLIAADLALAMSQDVPVVGMNLVFDFTILDRELRRNQLPTLPERLGRPIGPVIDALVLDRQVDRYRPGSRKLTELCKAYGVRIDGAHDAEFDALAAARVAYRIAQFSELPAAELTAFYKARGRKWPDGIARGFVPVCRMTVHELHEAQIGWRAEQCDGLRADYDAKGKTHNGIPGDWPMIPYTAQEPLL